MNLNKDAIRLLDRLYKDLYLNEQVLHHATGNKYDKFNNIACYLEKLESTHDKISTSNKHIEYLKKCYYDKYVIKKEDIPESYYKNQEQMYLERGFGHINITDEEKAQLQNEVIENQKRSLYTWIDYFLSDDSNAYPFWTKYWAFQGMLNLGYFDKEKSKFYKRTKDTVYPFCDLNREALSMSIDLLIKSLNKEEIEDKDLEILIKSGSFQKIYTYILTKVLNDNKNIAKRNIGKWVKYDQGSDHMTLVNSLQGYNTGWCTVGESTAREQLENGGFYVYYTLDDNDEYKVPRIAIRMEGNSIGEIRGIAENQNIESNMEKVVEEKLNEFPDKEQYYKKVNDMKYLTEIYKKYQNDIELTKEDLKFIYEIDNKIKGFGYEKDPRIKEILDERNKRKDLAEIFNCREDQISFNKSEITKETIYYYGALDLSSLRSAEGLILPKTIGGILDLRSLTSVKGLKLPETIGGTLYLSCLLSVEGLTLPETIGGGLYLSSLISAEGLILPKKIGGDLGLKSLTSAEGLTLPEIIGGALHLNSLTSAEGLKLPKTIRENLFLNSLISAEGLIIPEELTYNIHMNGFTITPKNVHEYRNNNGSKKYAKTKEKN